jgi:hypothetical protein
MTKQIERWGQILESVGATPGAAANIRFDTTRKQWRFHYFRNGFDLVEKGWKNDDQFMAVIAEIAATHASF